MWQHCVYTESDSVGRCVYDCDKVIGIEDSSAGIVSIKLVGFSCGYDGNIDQAGIGDMCDYRVDNLMKILDVLG